MIKYLVILLDDTSTSYCHYENEKCERKLIALDDLKAGILFAMKENLMIQFVYPDYELPAEYKAVIHTIDHSKIVPANSPETGDVSVFNGWRSLSDVQSDMNRAIVLRITKDEFFTNITALSETLRHIARLNVVITDIETFTDDDFDRYRTCLDCLSQELESLYAQELSPQLNLLTDRMVLENMNNCNAGWESIALAPDGKFYVCPAFYQTAGKTVIEETTTNIGDLRNGVDIKNPQLYKLSHAPICRNCDAYQCKRCVWLNRKTTLEVNTPSHEQCVIAHLERNTTRTLLQNIRKHGEFLPHVDIKKIDYLDPFDVRKEW